MENFSLMDPNLCCNMLLKLRCWLILAKYGASKLDVVKQMTQDVALDEFETRLYVKKRFSETSDVFTQFLQKVYEKTMVQVMNYICCPDWSIFSGNGNDSLWLLRTVIENETATTDPSSIPNSHDECACMSYKTKKEIFLVIDSWSNVTNTFSNYTNASLSYTFACRMRDLILKYEDLPHSADIRWLCEDILKASQHPWSSQSRLTEEKSCFWFVSETLGFHFYDDADLGDDFYMKSEEELSQILADWLFNESVTEFQTNTKRVLDFDNEETGARVYDKQKLLTLLDMPIWDLELHLMTAADAFFDGSNVADGPHYYVPNELIELQPRTTDSVEELISPGCQPEFKSGYDERGTAVAGVNDLENETSSDVKVGPGDVCEDNPLKKDGTGDTHKHDDKLGEIITDHDEMLLPKIQIISRNTEQKMGGSATYSTRHKRRGRPRKVDEFNHGNSKNSQHKYSPENVFDCSTWIKDNFHEVAGNKPAIDRARLYELYTNYCLLKLCTPVDRALFGKIIRKVFPKLRSRRLIQNQVLKYHYVGLKPKFAELEQTLLCRDSSIANPTEIILTYLPVNE